MDAVRRKRLPSFLPCVLAFLAGSTLADEPALLLTLETGQGGALLAVEPVTGARALLPLGRGTDLGGIARAANGELLVVDRGTSGSAARVIAVDPDTGTARDVTRGGFLARPGQCLLAPDGELLVLDREALGGLGALLRIDLVQGTQRLVSFGGSFEDPGDLLLEPAGSLLVLDHRMLRVNAVTGEQGVVPCVAAPFLQPLACALDPDGGALVCDGGTLLHLSPDDGAAVPVRDLPPGVRDFVLAPDGSGYFAWSDAGQGGIVHARPGELPETVLTGGMLADVRAITLVPDLPALSGGGDPPPDEPFQAPDPPALPPPTIELRADTVTLLHGPGPADDEVLPAGNYPLVTALRAATPGSDPVIGVYGSIPGSLVSIGGGDSDFKGYVAHWGAVPMRFAVVGMTSDARIREFSVWQKMNDGQVNGGVVDAWFQDLTIEARYSHCVSSPKGHTFGLLRFYDCRFVPDRETLAQGGYGGYGYKWGIRSQGRGRWDLRRCTFEPVQEHAVYIDSPQGDCYFVDLQHKGSTRTAIQVVNRSLDNPGASGFGTLLFERVRIFDLWGDGGSGITVAGHLGALVFRDVQARESPVRGASHGAIVVWTDDAPQHGVYLHRAADGRLYSTGRVTIESADIALPHADRSLVAIAGAEEVVIDGFSIQGSRAALSFDSPYGVADVTGPAVVDGQPEVLDHARVANGALVFRVPCPLSAYRGFGSAEKIQVGGRLLGDQEIDLLWCPP